MARWWDSTIAFCTTLSSYLITGFSQAIPDLFLLHSHLLTDVPKFPADIVESTAGAVFIDNNCSTDTVWKVFKDLSEPVITSETLRVHPVTQPYDVCQKRVKFEDLWRESMAFNAFVDDQLVDRGKYTSSKEIAHYRAAKDNLNNIGRILRQKDSICCIDDLQMEEDTVREISVHSTHES